VKYQGNAREIAESIVEQFKSGNIIAPLSQVFFQNPDLPSANYSVGNKLLIALTAMFRGVNYTGAGGFKFWQEKNRHVRKGEKAIYILAPLLGKREEEQENGEKKTVSYIYGFKSIPVFAMEQTEGEPLAGQDDREEFIKNLPFREVAEAWGISVGVDYRPNALGYYSPSAQLIGLAVKNLSTWAHELTHAADDRLHKLSFGQVKEEEIVAELGGAILLTLIGDTYSADIGGCWNYISSYAGNNDEEIISIVMSLLDRTSRCVQFIIDTAIEHEQKTLVTA